MQYLHARECKEVEISFLPNVLSDHVMFDIIFPSTYLSSFIYVVLTMRAVLTETLKLILQLTKCELVLNKNNDLFCHNGLTLNHFLLFMVLQVFFPFSE